MDHALDVLERHPDRRRSDARACAQSWRTLRPFLARCRLLARQQGPTRRPRLVRLLPRLQGLLEAEAVGVIPAGPFGICTKALPRASWWHYVLRHVGDREAA